MSTFLHVFIKCDSFADPRNICMSRLPVAFPYTVCDGEYAVFFMPYSPHDLRWPSRLNHYEKYGNVTAQEVLAWDKLHLQHLRCIPNWEEMVNWEGILQVFNEYCEFIIMLDQLANFGCKPLLAFFDANQYEPQNACEARKFLEAFIAREPVFVPFQDFLHEDELCKLSHFDDMETTYCLLPDSPEKRSRYSKGIELSID